MDLKPIMPRGLGAALAGYNVIAAGAWLWRAGISPVAILAVVLHLAVAAGLVAGLRVGARSALQAGPRWGLLLPWVMWLLAWSEIGWLYGAAPPVYHDGAVGELDLAVFGLHLNLALPRLWAGSVWREAMTAVYLSYYLLILGPPAYLAWSGRRESYWRHSSGLILTYLGAFTIYLCWPVQGPRDVALAAGMSAAAPGGVLPRIMESLFVAGDSVGTAFPSSHCAGAMAAALFCRGHFRPAVVRVIALWAALIVVSTVHTNNHYAIDSLAGCLLAALVFVVVRFASHGGFRTRSEEGRHEEDSGHRRHGFHWSPSGVPAGSRRAAAPRDGARPA